VVSDGVMDMSVWDESYWASVITYVSNLQTRGITAMLTVWDGHSDLPGGQDGALSLWNAPLNVQGVQWVYDTAALSNPNAAGSNNQKASYYQLRWVDRLLREMRTHSNVMFEINNEDPTNDAWYSWWAQHIKAAGYAVSVNNARSGGVSIGSFAADDNMDVWFEHNRSATSVTMNYRFTGKAVAADADTACEEMDSTLARMAAWESVLSGGGWNDFACWQTPTYPVVEKVNAYGILLRFVRGLPLGRMSPRPELTNGQYALASPGSEYLVYAPNGGDASHKMVLNLSQASGIFTISWLNPRSGEVTSGGTMLGGSVRSFTNPAGDANDWALLLVLTTSYV
jgi:hypothetical protein